MHDSIALPNIELINIEPSSFSPLISKCHIKVCYVSDEPNRNRSVITKETAREMAFSLRGAPIVGYYNENKEDFEEHNRLINIANGKFEVKDTTRPYGFVDLNAKCWFQEFDDEGTVHEYLMTEGWIWTGQYPEAQRVINDGNNQSMELDEKLIDAYWTKDDNGKPQFFIINEAIMEKLCILGADFEPCFEGANIAAPTIQFSFDDGFKEQLISMMNELKDLLNKGGTKVFTRYCVEVGDALWTALYSHVSSNHADYQIESVCEDEGKKYAVLVSDNKFYQLNFSVEEENYTFSEELVELENYTPSEEPQFDPEVVKNFKIEDKTVQSDSAEIDNNIDEGEKTPEVPVEEPAATEEGEETTPVTEEPAVPTYSLEEIPEYVELMANYTALEEKCNDLQANIARLEEEMKPLAEFKAQAVKKQKEEMIKSFYMLSDEDKEDVVKNIDTYSVEDIESKLSIICVRKKVNFSSLEDEEDNTNNGPTTYNLNTSGSEEENANVPEWVKAALQVAKNM